MPCLPLVGDLGNHTEGCADMKLTAAARKAIPASKFALPGGRYPIEDRSHAANAKARATQQVGKSLTSAQAATIRRKADKVLGK